MRVCDGISEGIARSLGHNGWGPCGLQVHAVLTVPVSVALIQPGPKGHHKRRLLVLVEQDGIAVLALALSLYEPLASESPPPGEQVTAYIDKLDSSGFLERAKDASVSLSRSVLEGLVEALLAIYSRLRLHVFARAQPQFLFPLSAKNPEKRILGVLLFVHSNTRTDMDDRNGPSFDGGPRLWAICLSKTITAIKLRDGSLFLEKQSSLSETFKRT